MNASGRSQAGLQGGLPGDLQGDFQGDPPGVRRDVAPQRSGLSTREWAALGGWRALTWAAQPLLHLKLRRRGVAEPGYLKAVPERFGRYSAPVRPAHTPLLWIHAVSLGETHAAAILVRELRRQRPGLRLLLTHGTATGRQAGRLILEPGDQQAWLPWDKPAAVRRFLAHFRPDAGVLMETEVWPELVGQCAAADLPLLLVNARMSARSAAAAGRWPSLAGPAYRQLAGVWAQSQADGERLTALGASVRAVCGNLKFDADPDPELRAQGRAMALARRASSWAGAPTGAPTGAAVRPVAMLASSREGEEAAWLRAVAGHPARDLLQWLIVPRHPQRFDAVARIAADAGWQVLPRSRWPIEGPRSSHAPTLWLGDSVGEMPMYYGMSDLVLMGGTFGPHGGQNLIEAAACGCPILLGPSTENFAEAAEAAIGAGAALPVPDLAAALDGAVRWIGPGVTQREDAARAALGLCAEHRGAASRMATGVLAALDGAPGTVGSASAPAWRFGPA